MSSFKSIAEEFLMSVVMSGAVGVLSCNLMAGWLMLWLSRK